ncbi:maltose/maltodextrin ABC transporter substrate-binding protein MalE [Limimaricola pyoseonensis]|uniref:Maltodextrin-binding protein n=1 Tax=Limimaricola pyoseonensis TaxID=521013 RepID=A0A1G7C2F0_9RHOB|nr:maltose/maltodextrin ABC transporter substrate-binding protein MalE [Limimaricola pyoseonensis]SDE33501.1 maltooligosaccharide-binding protein [Limimaricola pyoseonensis]
MTTLTRRLGTLALLTLTAAPAYAFEDGKLVIWTGDNRAPDALREVGAKFEEDYGIAVEVAVVEPLPEKFQQAAATGDGPDILMHAHDRLGEWSTGGIIAPVTPGAGWTDGILPAAMDAVTFDGATWGYPVAVEAVHLIYNKEFVDTPPADFSEIAGMELPEGVQPILWDYNNTYFTFPLLAANGGYAFQKVDGSYDGANPGVNTEGAVKGAEVLDGLIEDGVMPAGVDYGVMEGAMNNGEVAMVINGPWAWGNLASSGIEFGVAPLPKVDGQTTPPFLGVQALALNAASPNLDLAQEFVENYLLTDEGLATWNASGALGALADVSAAEAQDDEKVSAMLEVAADGVPMPSNPEMGAFWAAMQPALTNITNGAQEPQEALDDAAARIKGE